MKKSTAFWIFVFGGVIGLCVSLATAQMVKITGTPEFCSLCHVMKPMHEAFLHDVHGGNNSVGFKAECVSCHLPHNNVVSYIFIKARNGIKEVAINFLGHPENINWQEKRKDRKHFVYDSGCLSCHGNLKQATTQAGKSFLPHRDYFAKRTTKTCVECHEHVGHKALGLYLDTKNKNNIKEKE